VVLGVIYNNGLNHIRPLADIRFASVLGRIGLAYMFANIIFLYSNQRAQVAWCVFLLIGYWLLLALNAAPGFERGNLTMEGNFASFIDRTIIPGKLYLKIHDPEGLVSTVPAISTALLGIFTGIMLKAETASGQRKALVMLVTGVVFIGLALLWNFYFPINKNLWTSSFVLLAAGLSLILLSLFYFIIDVKGYIRWSFFFRVIGMNSILIYMSGRFINWNYSTTGFFGWVGQLTGDPFNAVVMACCLVFVKWAFLYFMYRQKIFLRV
jgi:predicted acyltransferase